MSYSEEYFYLICIDGAERLIRYLVESKKDIQEKYMNL